MKMSSVQPPCACGGQQHSGQLLHWGAAHPWNTSVLAEGSASQKPTQQTAPLEAQHEQFAGVTWAGMTTSSDRKEKQLKGSAFKS